MMDNGGLNISPKIAKGVSELEKTLRDAFLNNVVFMYSERQVADILSDVESKSYLHKSLEYKKYFQSIPDFDVDVKRGSIYRTDFPLEMDTAESKSYLYFYLPRQLTEEILDKIYLRTMDFLKDQLDNINKLIIERRDIMKSSIGYTREITPAEFDYKDPETLKKLEFKLCDLINFIFNNHSSFDRIDSHYTLLVVLYQLSDIILPLYEKIVEGSSKKEDEEKAKYDIPEELVSLLNARILKLKQVIMDPEKYIQMDKELAYDIKLYLFGIFFTNELTNYLHQSVSREIVSKKYLSGGDSTKQVHKYLTDVTEYLPPELKTKFIKYVYEPEPGKRKQVFLFTEKFKLTMINLKTAEKKKITPIDRTTLFLIFENPIKHYDKNELEQEAKAMNMELSEYEQILSTINSLYESIKYI